MKFIQILSDIICNTLLDPKALDRARRRKGAFTRNCGKLPYWTLIKLLLKNVKKTISASLDEFFHELSLKAGAPLPFSARCSQQAFSKVRSGISHSIFKECFERVLGFLCCRESLDSHARFMGVWGLQIIAIDGSRIPLPNRKALLKKYGSIGRDSSSPTAIASVAFDVLNNRVLDTQLEPVSVDERTLAIRHMDSIKSKARANPLYTMFVFGITDNIIILDGREVRVLKFYLPSGILETLITNDFRLNKNEFRQCYFLRWPVEENYKLVKEKIGLTNFRDYSENSILQEFWISMLLTNLALAIKKTDGIIDSTINQKGNKNKYMTNMNELVGCLSRHLPEYTQNQYGTQYHLLETLILV